MRTTTRRLLLVLPVLSYGLAAMQLAGPAPTESRNIDARTTRNRAELMGTATLTGKVSLDDDTQPDDAIVIEFACRGSVRSSVAADAKGRFSLPLSPADSRSEEHTSELQSLRHLV